MHERSEVFKDKKGFKRGVVILGVFMHLIAKLYIYLG